MTLWSLQQLEQGSSPKVPFAAFKTLKFNALELCIAQASTLSLRIQADFSTHLVTPIFFDIVSFVEFELS